MDSLGLAAIACEIRAAAAGGRCGAVVVPGREELGIALGGRALWITIAPADPRVHLIDRLPPPPAVAPSIQTHFESLLRGAEVESARTVDFDRVLHLDLAGFDRIGQPRRLTLIVELMGKHSACVVVDQEGLIVATLKTVTRAVNRHRELLARLPYVPPPGGARRDPLTLDRAAWDELWPQLATAGLPAGWRSHLFGLSDELWQWLTAHGGSDRDGLWAALSELRAIVAAESWQPCLRRDAEGRPAAAWPLLLPGGEPAANFSVALEQVAAHRGQRLALAQRRGEVLGAVARAAARVASGLKGLDRAAGRAAQADAWQHLGDLLLAHRHLIQAGATEIALPDWSAGGAEVTLPLDPTLPPGRQAEACFERAKRARRAVLAVPERRPLLEAEQARLIALQEQITAAATTAELERLAAGLDLGEAAAPARPAKPRTERERWLAKLERHVSPEGFTILVGRNAAESEGLLSRVAVGADLWFHVRGAGSGHVIVRAEGRPEAIGPATIEDAARWAARHSKMKHSALVPVVYTQRKYVTKVTGGAAGKVVYRGEKTIFVEP
jgi:predicted ribosome quality control (RQC) complex YloA/Tae2 family protein